MALEVGIAVLCAALFVVFSAVLFSFLKRLKDLNSEVLDLKKVVQERRPSVNSEVLDLKKRRPLVNRETTSLPDELDGFYGRDGDKEAIIGSLLRSDGANAGNLDVIPIVGMGGIGKTTLAQHVYNDKAVEEQFKVRAWVCVSDQFDVTKVTWEIVKKVTEGARPSDDLDQLQHKLKGALDGKKFLLVLDDVWSEDYYGWTKLLTPLRSGAEGSKIIITTRNKKVASKVQTVPTHDLGVLKDEDCWKLFARHAILDMNSAANPPEFQEELQEIGKKIVRKCGGLPLAAKALGGVLRCETEAKKWKEVLESEIWDWDVRKTNILPSLAMSYINLPSHLKRCFAYCAMFPQDYEFKKEELVALWTSEGFLVQQKGKKSLEEIGDTYFDDLVSRSFFQHSSDEWGERCFAMHDLVHDLARFVSGEFCSRLEEGTSSKIGERTRHLSYGRIVDDGLGIHETPYLRSFVPAPGWAYVVNEEFLIDGLLQTRRPLRVLFLSFWKTRDLSNSIGNLKHMRYLNLSGPSIRLLPEAVTDLFNLEILILRNCWSLVELPADMARLINLCQLDLSGTIKLKGMPPEMGKLKKLTKLSDFVVGENGGSSIKELGNLHKLRGEILIRGLENVKDDRDASEASLKDKENLKVLELKWEREDDSRQAKQVLERLQPHADIESITIGGYGGREFPNWVGGISFSKLTGLHMTECSNLVYFPRGGLHAPNLKSMKIEKCDTLKWLPHGMQSLFPSLEELVISWCPEIESLPEGGLPSKLRYVEIDKCKKLVDGDGRVEYLVESLSSVSKRMKIEKCGNSKWLLEAFYSLLSSLEELELDDCPKLLSLPNHLPSLKRLRISHWGELESLVGSTATTSAPSAPLFSPSLTSLEELGLYNCAKLLSVPYHLPSLKRLRIGDCDELDFENLLISAGAALETIDIRWNGKVKCISPETLPNLMELRIEYCYNLESLGSTTAAVAATTTRTSDPLFSPSLTSLCPNLRSMKIQKCVNLKWLPQGMHSLLPSLEELVIYGCPEIDSFPEGGLPSKLQSLIIVQCNKLVGGRMQWGLQSLPSLSRIGIGGGLCEGVESSFPEETLLPSSLNYLEINDFPKMKSLNYKGLQHLSSLQSLKIFDCKNLESLPEEGLPSSLSSLEIRGCPLLEKRCEREIGEYWPKIHHIHHFEIGGWETSDSD